MCVFFMTCPFQAVCDMVSAGGGWTVFQRRFDGQTDFNRTWQEYRDGFGSLQREHWLGNAVLYALTASGHHMLRITLQDWHDQTRHANYNNFKVAGENQRYMYTHILVSIERPVSKQSLNKP